MNSRLACVACLLSVLLIATPTVTSARWIKVDEDVPVDRLLTNLQRHVELNPDDAKGHYVLGRVHSLAYAIDGETVPVVPAKEGEDLPGFAPYHTIKSNRTEPLTDAARAHLIASIESYQKAVDLAPNEPLNHLGLGWMLEQASAHADELRDVRIAFEPASSQPTTQPATQPIEDRRRELERAALGHYVRVVQLAAQSDMGRRGAVVGADGPLSIEAGGRALHLLRNGRHDDPALDARLTETMKQLNRMPRAITPIIFALDVHRPLRELVNEHAQVTFDLVGDDLPRHWPWVTRDAGILVWDPQQRGQITSGRQLFGSSTWWMFWSDGYAALAALDDDGDGTLAGSELNGLAVWHDVNVNAICDAGEVRPVESFGIESIATIPSGRVDGTLYNNRGLTLEDGRSLPTYDWTPTGVPR